MIKEDLIKSVMSELALDRLTAQNMVETLMNIIKDSLYEGESIMVSGFGHFKVRRKKERIGRNPKTKEAYTISERNIVAFYPSKVLRKLIKPA